MEEVTLETQLEKGECLIDQDHKQENFLPEKIDEVTCQIHEPSLSDHNQKFFPISHKIDALSSKVQILRKEHKVLSDEVKGITDESLLGSEVVDVLRHFGSEHETLKKKYLKECLERKRLYNEVIELRGNIRVFCRCRPLKQEEIASGCSSIVEFNSSEDTELQIVCGDSSRKQFKFDHVFSPQDDQEAVFAQISPLVTSVLDGFNVCIFAYGQTGTGKTFTMEGTPESRGVNYRTLEKLFQLSEERSGTMKYELFVSMLEVYNEKIRDLLAENSSQGLKRLDIKQAADGTQDVPGLHEACVHNVDEVWVQLQAGCQNRAVGSTNVNELSSRSHCLFRVTVKSENLVNGQRSRSHLWLVDLAGSERVGRTEVEGERLKESQFINKSLSALGDVISALASKTNHIPYRNSKLTHLLQSSLGGDCKTLMFTHISPSSADMGETLCSLNFASRVRGVEHGPAHKQADHYELFKYKQMAEKQKQDEKEIMKLRNSLQTLQLQFANREQLCRSLKENVRDLESQLADEKKARLQQENRAAASAKSSALAFSFLNKNAVTEKKPPIGPSKLRPPLRGITNLPSVPEIPHRTGTAKPSSTFMDDKENISGKVGTTKFKTQRQPRRVSIAMRPAQATLQSHQPRRRVSIAAVRPDLHLLSTKAPANIPPVLTLIHHPKRRISIATSRPESHLFSTMTPENTSKFQTLLRQPRRRVSIATARPESHLFSTMTPQNTSKFQIGGSVMSRLSFASDSKRTSRLISPMPDLRSSPVGEITPVTGRSKFLGTPSMQVGSWKPKHPTVVALHRRHFVWSPLKQKSQKKERKSLLPTRSSGYWK
ncbi:Kinesin-like protein [Thalictrum thalictroides]|uniref:Kinesin-like protein n=1 Tax=Thalictrum thalictroides TaxID=46969 RepID=A0A7J6XDM4_THATH|nr:Kinesin-like protein [Thalictrum thalictroides]